VRGSGCVLVHLFVKLVSFRSCDRAGCGRQSGALWSSPTEVLSPGGPDAASSFASAELWSARSTLCSVDWAVKRCYSFLMSSQMMCTPSGSEQQMLNAAWMCDFLYCALVVLPALPLVIRRSCGRGLVNGYQC
jgi:hypothetical protein